MTATRSAPRAGPIFHLVLARAWEATAPAGAPEGPVAVEQFERHGFVHCCFREQLTEIASWWFDPADDLVAVKIDPSELSSELRIEPSPSRWHPHVYGPIDARAVVGMDRVPRDGDGEAELPPALRHPPPGFCVTGRLASGPPEAAVRWRPGILEGDTDWIAAAHRAIDTGRLVPLVGGICVAADLHRAYETFALLAAVASEIVRYDGDGFFEWPAA